MNRTSFTCTTLVLLFLGATADGAAPIRYSVDWVNGPYFFADVSGLSGAHIHFEALLDPAMSTPTVNPSITEWSGSQACQVTVTGSSHADGTWFGYTTGWTFINDEEFTSGDFHVDSPADVVIGNPFYVGIAGYQMVVSQLNLALAASFNTSAPDGTIFPYPFENSDLLVRSPVGMSYDFGGDGSEIISSAYGQNVSARAEVVPEPTAWILALLAAIGLATREVQKRSRRNSSRRLDARNPPELVVGKELSFWATS